MNGCKLDAKAHLRAEELPLGESIIAYFETRRSPGHFLHNLLANDLMGAFAHADDTNATMMQEYARFLYNCVPSPYSGIWGSHEAVNDWLAGKTE